MTMALDLRKFALTTRHRSLAGLALSPRSLLWRFRLVAGHSTGARQLSRDDLTYRMVVIPLARFR